MSANFFIKESICSRVDAFRKSGTPFYGREAQLLGVFPCCHFLVRHLPRFEDILHQQLQAIDNVR